MKAAEVGNPFCRPFPKRSPTSFIASHPRCLSLCILPCRYGAFQFPIASQDITCHHLLPTTLAITFQMVISRTCATFSICALPLSGNYKKFPPNVESIGGPLPLSDI